MCGASLLTPYKVQCDQLIAIEIKQKRKCDVSMYELILTQALCLYSNSKAVLDACNNETVSHEADLQWNVPG